MQSQPTARDASSTPVAIALHCGGDFEGEILRSEFGAAFGRPLIGDRVRLVVQAEGRRR